MGGYKGYQLWETMGLQVIVWQESSIMNSSRHIGIYRPNTSPLDSLIAINIRELSGSYIVPHINIIGPDRIDAVTNVTTLMKANRLGAGVAHH